MFSFEMKLMFEREKNLTGKEFNIFKQNDFVIPRHTFYEFT